MPVTFGNYALHNARIWTADSARPTAQSLVIEDGRVVAIDSDVPPHSIDVQGRTVLPGLIDAHMHLRLGGEALSQVDLTNVTSRAEFEAAIEQRHRELLDDQWLIAGGWSSERLGEDPDRSWLRAAGSRPVVCHRMDIHVSLVNDAVLALIAQEHDLSHDPEGGRVVRDGGEPTGLLVEAAAWKFVNPLIPNPTVEQQQNAVRAAQEHCHAFGLTTVGTMEYRRDIEKVFEPLREELTLRCRATVLDRDWPLPDGLLDWTTTFENDDRMAVIGCKAFLDGTLGSRTARLLDDYADEPSNRGLWLELAKDGHLHAWYDAVAEVGLSPSMHAIGDAAFRLALDAIEHNETKVIGRIEHAQQIHEEDFARCAGRMLSMQPLHKADDGCYAEQRLGDKRLAGTFAFRSLLNAGAHIAFGSDWPVVACDPMLGIRAAVTGIVNNGSIFLPEQNLTIEESLMAYTRTAAECLGAADLGVLKKSNRGDLVVLDSDPIEADWVDSPPRVIQTISGGRVVYDADAT